MGFVSKLLRNIYDGMDKLSEFTEASDMPILGEEKQYYKDDSYYTKSSYTDSLFERMVITFGERKKTAIPSSNGLYVPEILLLSYCERYPNPKNGYPGFWWFKYGIRNVGAVLKTLESRGFIVLNVETGKYSLTPLGEQELSENEYVVFMHKNSVLVDYTAWEMNVELGNGDKSNYKEIAKRHGVVDKKIAAENRQSELARKKKLPLSKVESLNTQEKQIEAIQVADAQYKEDGDIEYYIAFLGKIWNSNGLLFAGSKMDFYACGPIYQGKTL